MSGNMTETICDLGSVELAEGQFRDDTLTVAGAETVKAGTILARASNTGKLVVFVKGGSSNENGIPKAVLTYEIVATASGDLPVRVLVAGSVRKDRLVIFADGDDANVDSVVCDQLRSYSIVPIDVQQLDGLDNIPPEDS